MKKTFTEVQKFTQWWLWLILIGISVMAFYEMYVQLVMEENPDKQSLSNTGLIVLVFTALFLLVLFSVMRLKTEINSEGIKMNYFPFLRKMIYWRDVRVAEVLNYGFVGGWGIRIWTKYGTVYNITGNKGLAIELKNGKKLLIGTQKEDEMRQVVEEVKPK